MYNRLDNIATRQRSSRLRDLLFALGVAAATIASIATVSTAAEAASVHVSQR